MPNEHNLTARQIEVLELMLSGASNRQIARSLHISLNTVKVHVANILRKLEAGSRTQAVMIALQQGLIQAPAGIGAAPGLESSRAKSVGERARSLTRSRLFIVVVGIATTALVVGFILWSSTSQPAAQDADAQAVPERWTVLPDMLTPRESLALSELNGELFAIGGVNEDGALGVMERFDPIARSWSALIKKPTPVYEIQSVVVGGKIYIPGGRTAELEVTDAFEVYDPQTGQWSQAHPVPQPLSSYALAEFEGKIYLFGGWNGEEFVDSTHIYDPTLDTWSTGPPLPRPLGHAGATAYSGGILVLGGKDQDGGVREAWSYTPALESTAQAAWQELGSLPDELVDVDVVNLAGFVFVAGPLADRAPAAIYLYIPLEDKWSEIEPAMGMNRGRFVTAKSSPYLYFLGGRSDSGFSPQVLSYRAVYTVAIPVGQQP